MTATSKPHNTSTATSQSRSEILRALRNQCFRIEGLQSAFCAWCFKVNPDIDRIRADVSAWLASEFSDHPKLAKLQRGDYGLFGATWWPEASFERLRIATYLSIWLFIWDDELDSDIGSLAANFDLAQLYRSETLRFIESSLGLSNNTSTTSNRVIRSFKIIGDALRESLTLGE